ncbi:MAG: hypothetical protein JW944_13730 [Deltaproteobacteria bacterium]|nr:hypothetical protein [Deltaproteobacteria bacterium]
MNNLFKILLILMIGIFTITGSGGGGDEDEEENGNGDDNPTTVQQWTWVSGDNRVKQKGTYGTSHGTTGTPGARVGSSSWKDSDDILWLFGGDGYDNANLQGYLNDLWKYESGQWIWVSGSDTAEQSGTYDTLGAAGTPGARYYAMSWTDSYGNMWLFGGYGYDSSDTPGDLNDLWKFSPSLEQWEWISGSDTIDQSGTYGDKGSAAPSNVPGARESGLTWTDSLGNLWLFGGYGFDSADSGLDGELNDLWVFDPDNNQWTWVAGDDTVNQPSTSYYPGSRDSAVSWMDSDGNMWLFGGWGFDKNSELGYLNDLWKYNPNTKQWSRISGSDVIDQSGIYGTMGTAAPSNVPGSRYSSVSWTDSSGILWLFGGHGFDSSDPKAEGELNDLWKIDTSLGQWTWVSGSSVANQRGVYGTIGTAEELNTPGARYLGVSWIDSSDNLWLFGGYGYDGNATAGELNDLWRFER